MKRILSLVSAFLVIISIVGDIQAADGDGNVAGPPGDGWKLVFDEQFDGSESDLDARWQFQNGPSGHILSSRWRDNAWLEDGILKMVGRKEQRAGQEWTAANLWTRQQFKYGYFECRYRYAPATGTNNSFWLMSTTPRTRAGLFRNRYQRGPLSLRSQHEPAPAQWHALGQGWAMVLLRIRARRHPRRCRVPVCSREAS